MTGFRGIWVPLVTPFRDGGIDFPALRALTRHLVHAGVSGLAVCGSTGEAAALTPDEQLAALDAVLEAAPATPVMMGLGGPSLAGMSWMQERVLRRPVAGLLVPPPCYIRPSPAGVIQHFTTLADASSVPLVVYNIPYRTGVEMSLDTLREIARHPRITAIKDCGGDPLLTMNLIQDRQLDVLAGEDHQIFNTLCLGGAGAISASAHLRPDLFVQLARRIEAQDLARAQQLFHRLLPMMQWLFEEPNPSRLKAALAQEGRMVNELRPPLQTCSPIARAEVADLLAGWNQRDV